MPRNPDAWRQKAPRGNWRADEANATIARLDAISRQRPLSELESLILEREIAISDGIPPRKSLRQDLARLCEEQKMAG